MEYVTQYKGRPNFLLYVLSYCLNALDYSILEYYFIMDFKMAQQQCDPHAAFVNKRARPHCGNNGPNS